MKKGDEGVWEATPGPLDPGTYRYLLDVDGVLTDGRFLLMADGTDGRSFHTRDGHAIRMGQRAGLQFAILSGRRSRATSTRRGMRRKR